MKKITRLAFVYGCIAGACDGLTGIMLLVAPLVTLRLMNIPHAPSEPIYMQWIGAFVFSVGFSYLIPLLSRDRATRYRRALSVFEFTAWIRLVIALFTSVAIFRGALDVAWIAVPLTDISFASIQYLFLYHGAFQPDSA